MLIAVDPTQIVGSLFSSRSCRFFMGKNILGLSNMKKVYKKLSITDKITKHDEKSLCFFPSQIKNPRTFGIPDRNVGCVCHIFSLSGRCKRPPPKNSADNKKPTKTKGTCWIKKKGTNIQKSKSIPLNPS